jgi:transposase
MTVYAGLDVSSKHTSICVVDNDGTVLMESQVVSDPKAVKEILQPYRRQLRRIGIEASSTGTWLQRELGRLGLEAVVIEACHAHTSLSAMRNKTDRNDARGLAQLMRLGWFKVVHVKSDHAQRLRMLLGCRKLVVRKLVDTENEIRGTLRGFGLKPGHVSRTAFAGKVGELVAGGHPMVQEVMVRMLSIRGVLLEQRGKLDRLVVKAVREEEVCRRFMAIPGVGPIAALAFRAGVDDPRRFKRSRTVGAHFGITPRRYQSGEVNIEGHISKCGDRMVRQALWDAAGSMLRRCRRHSAILAWGLRLVKRGGLQKATVAVSRKLATIMHRMWLDGTEFRWKKGPLPAALSAVVV